MPSNWGRSQGSDVGSSTVLSSFVFPLHKAAAHRGWVMSSELGDRAKAAKSWLLCFRWSFQSLAPSHPRGLLSQSSARTALSWPCPRSPPTTPATELSYGTNQCSPQGTDGAGELWSPRDRSKGRGQQGHKPKSAVKQHQGKSQRCGVYHSRLLAQPGLRLPLSAVLCLPKLLCSSHTKRGKWGQADRDSQPPPPPAASLQLPRQR